MRLAPRGALDHTAEGRSLRTRKLFRKNSKARANRRSPACNSARFAEQKPAQVVDFDGTLGRLIILWSLVRSQHGLPMSGDSNPLPPPAAHAARRHRQQPDADQRSALRLGDRGDRALGQHEAAVADRLDKIEGIAHRRAPAVFVAPPPRGPACRSTASTRRTARSPAATRPWYSAMSKPQMLWPDGANRSLSNGRAFEVASRRLPAQAGRSSSQVRSPAP